MRSGSKFSPLTPTRSGNAYEAEADRLATSLSPAASRSAGSTGPAPGVSRSRPLLPRPASADASPNPDLGAGVPLDAGTEHAMSARLGYDFSRIRVHHDAAAARSARLVNARAYTLGTHLVFGAGTYAPGSEAGQRLILHELVHSVQQSQPQHAMAGHETTSVRLHEPPTLRRKVAPDLSGTSIGEDYLSGLTPDQLRSEIAVVVAALRAGPTSEAERTTLEQNLEVMEEYAAARDVDIPSATAYRFERVIIGLAEDLQAIGAELKAVAKTDVRGGKVGNDLGFSPFYSHLMWDVEQVDWATNTLKDAIPQVRLGEQSGPGGPDAFTRAGTRIIAAFYVMQATFVHLGYLRVGTAYASEYGGDRPIESKLSMVRGEMERFLPDLRSLDPARVASAVAELQKPSNGFSWDFGEFVEELESSARGIVRFRKIVGIIQLALLARGLMMPRGGPTTFGGGMRPSLAGVSGGGAAVATGTVALEWIESLRRLVAIGAIGSVAATGRIGSPGTLPAAAKPNLLAAGMKGIGGGPKPATAAAKPGRIGGFKEIAGKIHGLRRPKGQAVSVVQVEVNGKIQTVAAANSSARFTPAQRQALKDLGVKPLPSFGNKLVHAEQNVARWVARLRQAGKQVKVLRWGISATRTGEYICAGCRDIIRQLGGVIEEFSAMGKTY